MGATTGFVLGAAADIAKARMGRHFVREIADALGPGHTALVAEIDEEDTDPVDGRMQTGSARPTGLERARLGAVHGPLMTFNAETAELAEN